MARNPSGRAGTGHVDIEPNLDGFDKKLERGVRPSLEKVGRSISKLGRGLTAGLTVPIVAIGATSIKAASDFESAFAGVRKTVDASEEDLGKLERGIRDMAKEIPATTTEIAAVAEAAGQLGVATPDILKFTRTMIDLGETTNLTAEEAAESFARIGNIMKFPQDQVDRLGAVVVDLGNKFAATEAEIVEFATRIAGAGKVAGLSVQDVAAIGAAMASVGVEAEAGGTAVQKVLLSITEAVATGSDDLAVFAKTAGKSAAEFAKQWKDDPIHAFDAFVQGLGKSGDKAFVILRELGLTDQRLIRAFLSLAGAGDILTRAVDVANTAFGENRALTDEARKRYETFAAKLDIFKNRIKDIGITLGTALLPIVDRLLQRTEPFVNKIAELAEKFSKLPAPVQDFILKIAGLAAALGPLLIAVGAVVNGAVALAPLFSPIGLAIAGVALAIGGLVLLVKNNWPAIKEVILGVWDTIRPAVENFRDAIVVIGEKVQEWWPKIKEAAEDVWPKVKELIDEAKPLLRDIIQIMADLAKELGPVVATMAAFAAILGLSELKIGLTVLKGIAAAINAIVDAISRMPGWARKLLLFAPGGAGIVPSLLGNARNNSREAPPGQVVNQTSPTRIDYDPSEPGSALFGHRGGLVSELPHLHKGGLASNEALSVLRTDEFVVPPAGMSIPITLTLDGDVLVKKTVTLTTRELERHRRARSA